MSLHSAICGAIIVAGATCHSVCPATRTTGQCSELREEQSRGHADNPYADLDDSIAATGAHWVSNHSRHNH